jgi:gluconate 5-dehydrogenase
MVMEIFKLQGKRALITGSSGGIGFALARGLGQAGAKLILNGRDDTKLKDAAQILRDEGFAVETACFDVTDSQELREHITQLTAITPIDILVNNAGIQRRMALEDFPEETWHELMNTNLHAVFLVGQAVARTMIKAGGGGSIINICSVQSELGRPNIAPYAASKGAVKMLTKGMAIDWGKYGIRVNGLGPGYFATELNAALVKDEVFSSWLINRTPLKRWGNVEELGGSGVPRLTCQFIRYRPCALC